MRKLKFSLALVAMLTIAVPAMAADDCAVHAMKATSLTANSDTLQIDGAHIRPATANQSIDAGNTEFFTVPSGADYLRIVAGADVWVRVSSDGSSAVVDQDVLVKSGNSYWVTDIVDAGGVYRKIIPGDVVKCVADS